MASFRYNAILESLAITFSAAALLSLSIADTAWPWIADDAFITLRYSQRLIEGHGLTWTDAECVEGYSNLTWLLLCSALGALGIDLIVACRALGITCTVATFIVLLKARGPIIGWPMASMILTFASLAATSLWAVGGLEAPLVGLLVAMAAASVGEVLEDSSKIRRPALLKIGAILGFLVLSRPDGPIWVAVTICTVAIHTLRNGSLEGRRLATVAWILLIPALALLGQTVFRCTYHGDWMPNTARAKLDSFSTSIGPGLDYVLSQAVALRALVLPAVLGAFMLRDRSLRATVLFACIGSAAWWGYCACVGGDYFPRSRMVVPSMPLLVILASHGLHRLSKIGRVTSSMTLCFGAACICVASFDARSKTDNYLSDWEWRGLATGTWMRAAFGAERPLLAVDAAGAVPYASGMDCIDMLGLCTREIAMTPPPPGMQFAPGHHRANGAFVLSRRPDIVIFGTPPGSLLPWFQGGRQMMAMPEFRDEYRMVMFLPSDPGSESQDPTTSPIMLWLRWGGRLGPKATGNETPEICIPGFWLGALENREQIYTPTGDLAESSAGSSTDEMAAAAWLASGVQGLAQGQSAMPIGRIRNQGTYSLPPLQLSPGTWRVTTESSMPSLQPRLVAAQGTCRQSGEGMWDVQASASGSAPHVIMSYEIPPDTAMPATLRRIRLVMHSRLR